MSDIQSGAVRYRRDMADSLALPGIRQLLYPSLGDIVSTFSPPVWVYGRSARHGRIGVSKAIGTCRESRLAWYGPECPLSKKARSISLRSEKSKLRWPRGKGHKQHAACRELRKAEKSARVAHRSCDAQPHEAPRSRHEGMR
jgi:hypothetical protein